MQGLPPWIAAALTRLAMAALVQLREVSNRM